MVFMIAILDHMLLQLGTGDEVVENLMADFDWFGLQEILHWFSLHENLLRWFQGRVFSRFRVVEVSVLGCYFLQDLFIPHWLFCKLVLSSLKCLQNFSLCFLTHSCFEANFLYQLGKMLIELYSENQIVNLFLKFQLNLFAKDFVYYFTSYY